MKYPIGTIIDTVTRREAGVNRIVEKRITLPVELEFFQHASLFNQKIAETNEAIEMLKNKLQIAGII